MTNDDKLSVDSMIEASRDRSEFSGHGTSKGAAGFVPVGGDPQSAFLSSPGQTEIINPQEGGFGPIRIDAAWDNVVRERSHGALRKFLHKVRKSGVDIDLGCLYEMVDGERGCVQAFGENMGAFDSAPFISLSGDERTGDTAGSDESLFVNGKEWNAIKRVLLYAYIYGGAPNWGEIRPRIQVSVPGEHPMVVTPDVAESTLCVCAIATIENIRGGMRLTNNSEYFPGHAEMDRAFGYGIEWGDGQKNR